MFADDRYHVDSFNDLLYNGRFAFHGLPNASLSNRRFTYDDSLRNVSSPNNLLLT